MPAPLRAWLVARPTGSPSSASRSDLQRGLAWIVKGTAYDAHEPPSLQRSSYQPPTVRKTPPGCAVGGTVIVVSNEPSADGCTVPAPSASRLPGANPMYGQPLAASGLIHAAGCAGDLHL